MRGQLSSNSDHLDLRRTGLGDRRHGRLLRTSDGRLLVQPPGADGALWVSWRRGQLAFPPEAELSLHCAAEDAILHWSDHTRGACAADLLGLRLDEWALALVDADAAAEDVVEPEGIIHQHVEIEEVHLGRRAFRAGGSNPFVEADARWSTLGWRERTLLRHAAHVLHDIAEAIVTTDAHRGAAGVDAQLLGVRSHKRRHRTDTDAIADAVPEPLGVVQDVGAVQFLSHGIKFEVLSPETLMRVASEQRKT